MEYIKLPRLHREVSRVGLGTWAMGGWMWGGSDADESVRTILTAVDLGITLIDTAPVYGFGASEEIVGRALRELGGRQRRALFVATKAGLEWSQGRVFRHASAQRLRRELEDSLRRLGVEAIDLYQVHWPDPREPMEEVAEAMGRFLEEGKVRALGVSNFSVDEIKTFVGTTSLHTCQPPYNLFEREAEKDVLPYCREHKIGVLAYGALCRGLLSGKMTPDREFRGDDLRKGDPKFQQPRLREYLGAVEALDEFGRERFGKRVLPLAVRWILDQGVEVALWGARRPEQLSEVEQAMGWSLGTGDRKNIEDILSRHILNPVGPGFMAPPSRKG